MIVGTTEAASILNISTARLRVLLMAGRVKGAYKTGKIWLMPLFNGKPIIQRGKRGPAPRWRNPRTPAKTIIHVNTHIIKENHNFNRQKPVITVKKPCHSGEQAYSFLNSGGELYQKDISKVDPAKTGILNLYGHEVEILGGCRVVYCPNGSKYGAKVWIETLYDVEITCWD